MSKRVTGIIIMLVGGLTFMIGAVLFITSHKKQVEETSSAREKEILIANRLRANKKESAENTLSIKRENNESPELKNWNNEAHASEIDQLVDLAIADGLLTENEKAKIRQIAEKYNIDHESLIRQAEEKLQKSTTGSETELVDQKKKNGLEFEKYIVQKFDKKYFKIKNWAGDKYVNGYYAETTPQPDILFEFKLGGSSTAFALECKWRKSTYKGGIEFASAAQLERYMEYQQKEKVPVFIAIGLGGSGAAPENLYILPLREVETNFVSIKKLKMYEKEKHKNFFFDQEALTLK